MDRVIPPKTAAPAAPPVKVKAKARTPKGPKVSSADVLEVYQKAVREDLTYDQLLDLLVSQFNYKNKDLAAARVHRLNSYLRKNFDGVELTTLRGSPNLPKSSKRLRELFKDAVERIDRKG